MQNISEIDRKGLIEALGLKEEEVYEAKYNLLGFYGTLYKIKQRLKNEGKYKITEEVKND